MKREAAVAGRVVADRVELDVVGEGEAGGGDLAIARVGSGSAGVCLFVALAGPLGHGGGDPPVGAGVGERDGGGLLDRDAGLEPAPGASELGIEGLDRGDAGVDPGGPGAGVAAGLGGGVHPHDPVALHRGQWRSSGGVDLIGVTLPRPGVAGGFGPERGVGLQVLAERAVLGAGAGHHGDEPATAAVDMAHRRS